MYVVCCPESLDLKQLKKPFNRFIAIITDTNKSLIYHIGNLIMNLKRHAHEVLNKINFSQSQIIKTRQHFIYKNYKKC